jgi:hypothetical protein
VALWQGLVRVEGDKWPTNLKPLVAPEPKKERTTEKDRLCRTTLQHSRAHALVRARKNKVAPTDPGHFVQGCVEDPPSVGIKYLATRHPANCRTTRTQTSTTGTPQKTSQLPRARRHLLDNQPAQTKSNVSYIVSVSSKTKKNMR